MLERDGEAIYLAGVDDAHYFRADNMERAADAIPEEAISILLSHSPEIYKSALHAAFDVMLSGHTHGGQICLPGGWPLTCQCQLQEKCLSRRVEISRTAGLYVFGFRRVHRRCTIQLPARGCRAPAGPRLMPSAALKGASYAFAGLTSSRRSQAAAVCRRSVIAEPGFVFAGDLVGGRRFRWLDGLVVALVA